MPPINNTNDEIQGWSTLVDWHEARPVTSTGLSGAFTAQTVDTERIATIQAMEREVFNATRESIVRGGGLRASPYREKVSRKVSTLKELDKISSSNKDLFSAIDKLNKDLSTLYPNSVDELVKKYGQLVACAIHNPTPIEKISKSKIAKDIPGVMRRYVIGETYYKIDKKLFSDRYLNILAKFVDTKKVGVGVELIEELYSLFTKEYEIRQELDKLMCNNKKESTVCEDYLYSNPRPRNRFVITDFDDELI